MIPSCSLGGFAYAWSSPKRGSSWDLRIELLSGGREGQGFDGGMTLPIETMNPLKTAKL